MKVELIEITGPSTIPGADCRNVLIYGDGQVGRDPCATGTCAKIALEVSKGRLKVGQEYVYQGIMDTVYRGRAVKEIKVGEYNAVVPAITGRTFVTAFHQFVVDFEDPLPEGWLL
jgi:proline racemase